MKDLLSGVLDNKHTSLAALVLFAVGVAKIFWPAKASQLEQVQTLALTYGLLRAGDASANPQLPKP